VRLAGTVGIHLLTLLSPASALLVPPPAMVQVNNVVQAAPVVDSVSLFPAVLIADTKSDLDQCFAIPACKAKFDEAYAAAKAKAKADKPEEVSPAKAKILAAKKAAADKAAVGGYKEAEGKSFTLNVPDQSAEEKDPFAEADALKEKVLVLKEMQANRPLSKAQSAQLAQLRQMEVNEREKARAVVAKAEVKAAREQSREERLAQKAQAGSASGSESYADSYKKVTGGSLPSLPSLPTPALPSLPSLPF